ncbi:MAG: GNAT family N-acetyltransferase [Thermoplasmata archaeon]|nr:GNAT family N-acetyltransferase [Thermoplasmata archaeon]
MFRPTVVQLHDGRRVLLRRAKPADAAGMIAHANAVGAEGIYIMTERLDLSLREERAKIRAALGGSGLWIVAVAGDEIVGSADIARGRHRKSHHVGELGIALRKDHRGAGLGRAMMESMIAWARSAGIRKLSLSVFSSNRPARGLYRSLGFVREGRLRGHVILRRKPDDVLLMSRWL